MSIQKDLEYLKQNKFQRALDKIIDFFCGIPAWFIGLCKAFWNVLVRFGLAVKNEVLDIIHTFTRGTWATKVSYLIMGFRNFSCGQILKGILFLLFEGVFIAYMVLAGGYWLSKFNTLGTISQHKEYNEVLDTFVTVPGDDSFKILLYGLLTIAFIIAFIVTWHMNVKQAKLVDEIIASGKKVKSGKDDLKSLLDDQFHKSMLALPVLGILIFTVLPVIFMILVAFTNYDATHDGYSNLFTWVGFDNFNELFSGTAVGGGNLSYTFGEILSWTLIWAFFATFTNYFLGMVVAMMINKKGIKLKKLWRGILVLTIAVPQFISLLYVARLFDLNGLINGTLLNVSKVLVEWGWIKNTYVPFDFWGDPTVARILVIVINIWIGIPYLMLITTGVLMNIPSDLYESAKIDGANVWQQYVKITLPYMLFVTGPYLLTNFIGNLNNFNVIYLLTGGGPNNEKLLTSGGSAGDTDLLITWLFKITTGSTNNYKLASVVGILIFVVVAVLSLIVYNVIPSTKNEEDYS